VKGTTVTLLVEQQAEPMSHALHLGIREASFGLSSRNNLTGLENSKPQDEESQEFACLGNSNQNTRMQIETIRRAKLRKWFSERSFPTKEKSYISQLLKEGNAFGERTARRLEKDYGMGDMYLDTLDDDEQAHPPAPGSQQQQPQLQVVNTDALLQAIRLLELFHSADERGRADMLRLAETLCGPHYHIGSNKG
jgi:hypothetical protein